MIPQIRYIDDQGTGDLIIRGSADIKLQSASGENYIIANDTGSVEQYFDNSKKTETTSGGSLMSLVSQP